jgi:hypothetical protein
MARSSRRAKGRPGAAWLGYTGIRPEAAQRESEHEWERTLEEIAERERAAEVAVPHRHPVRGLLAKFRRKR